MDNTDSVVPPTKNIPTYCNTFSLTDICSDYWLAVRFVSVCFFFFVVILRHFFY